jgi:hypothetical protein
MTMGLNKSINASFRNEIYKNYCDFYDLCDYPDERRWIADIFTYLISGDGQLIVLLT